jgi:preprotein translocase subunit SecA
MLTLQYLVSVDDVTVPAATPTLDKLIAAVQKEGEAAFARKVQYLRDFGASIGIGDVDQQVLSQVTLSVIDEKWKDHLYDLDQLRNAIQYRAYGQKDPLVEYKKEAFEMFQDLMSDLRSTFTDRYLKVQVNVEAPPPPRRAPPPPPPPTRATTDDLFAGGTRASNGPPPPAPIAPPVTASGVGRLGQQGGNFAPVGRNDPCPCGSGKKYKKCHGATG